MSKWEQIIQAYLIDNDAISELETNGTSSVFVRQKGIRIEIPNIFTSEKEYIEETRKLANLVSPDEEPEGGRKFLAEGKLDLGPAGSARCHIVLPPASDYPLVTIAKKSVSLTTLEDIYRSGSMSNKMYNFLKASVEIGQTIVFSGSTGAGKTTILEAMTKFIPEDVRIGVVEDAPELLLTQPNTVYLHSKPWQPGMDPNNEVTLNWCTKQINRMRTDKLIIGESRGAEFAEFLICANSGMNGSMTTLHANSPKLALQKMTQFVMLAKEQPIRIINKNIATTIDLIVQLEKFPNGQYKMTSIEEVSRILGRDESAEIATTPLSVWDSHSKSWSDSFLISDNLRKAFESHGYECQNFTKHKSFSTEQYVDEEDKNNINSNRRRLFGR